MKKKIFLITAFVLFSIFTVNIAQTQVNLPNTNQGFNINADMTDIFTQISTPSGMNMPGTPMEGTIDPTSYIIGPNDLFVFGLYGYVNQQLQLYVNPEGSVIIPTVGEIKIDS